MNIPKVLSGKVVSESVYSSLSNRISYCKHNGITPGLAAILVGDDPASHIYIRTKTKKFQSLGLFTKTFHYPHNLKETELIDKVKELNEDSLFNGILVQLPLPLHINSDLIINSIAVDKDVDGFHPENVGLLSIGKPRFIPCTPKGIMRIFRYYKIDLKGKHIVVLGRSNIVGRPISILTSLNIDGANGTTTLCHSRTENLNEITKMADVIIIALGFPNFLKADMIKDDCIVIDVGINRVKKSSSKGYKIVGDVDWGQVSKKASYLTPVPGGVGPMTIAMLVENTIEAAEAAI